MLCEHRKNINIYTKHVYINQNHMKNTEPASKKKTPQIRELILYHVISNYKSDINLSNSAKDLKRKCLPVSVRTRNEQLISA